MKFDSALLLVYFSNLIAENTQVSVLVPLSSLAPRAYASETLLLPNGACVMVAAIITVPVTDDMPGLAQQQLWCKSATLVKPPSIKACSIDLV